MKTLLLYLILHVSYICFGQTTLITYNDFIEGVTQNNPLAKHAANEKKYAELHLKASRGNYDPLVIGNYDQKQFGGTNYFTKLNSEIKQPVFTNQYLKFGYDYGIGSNINPEFYTPSQGLPYVGLEAGVLQGLIIEKRGAEVLKSKAYIDYYTAEQKIQINDLLYESAQRYFEWLFSTKQIAVNNYFLNTARKRLEGIEALVNIGERAPADTIEAAIFYQTRLLDLQNAMMDNQKSTNDILALIWQNDAPLQLKNTLNTYDSLEIYYTKAKLILAENLNLLPLQNPLILKYDAYQKVLDTEVRLKKEMIKPVLNVKYNFLSNSDLALNPAFSNNNYKWGLNMSFPLLLRNPVNEYKMAKVISLNNNLELLNKSNELNFKANALQKNVGILAQQLLNAERSVSYSKMLLNAEKLKFDNGESSLFMLNTRENKLLETELKLAEYKLKLIKTVLNIIYLNGNLNYKL